MYIDVVPGNIEVSTTNPWKINIAKSPHVINLDSTTIHPPGHVPPDRIRTKYLPGAMHRVFMYVAFPGF